MIKIYKVDSLEKLEYLLNTLHERGSEWVDGKPLDSKKDILNTWNVF